MDLIGLLSSAFGGGITGLLGAGVSKFFDYKTQKLKIEESKLKFEQEISLRKLDAEITQAEWSQRAKVAEIETTGKVEAADSEAFRASMQMEPQRYFSGKGTKGQNWLLILLDFLRGIIRPGLTIYLCVLTTMVYVHARNVLNAEFLSPEEASRVLSEIINTILYLSTTAILWWFGSRARKMK